MHISTTFVKPAVESLDRQQKSAELLADNGAKVLTKIKTHTKLKHYLSRKPYTRFSRKMIQYLTEQVRIMNASNPKAICDEVCRNHT